MPLMRSRQGRVVCCSCRADVVTDNPQEANSEAANEAANGVDDHAASSAEPDSRQAEPTQNDEDQNANGIHNDNTPSDTAGTESNDGTNTLSVALSPVARNGPGPAYAQDVGRLRQLPPAASSSPDTTRPRLASPSANADHTDTDKTPFHLNNELVIGSSSTAANAAPLQAAATRTTRTPATPAQNNTAANPRSRPARPTLHQRRSIPALEGINHQPTNVHAEDPQVDDLNMGLDVDNELKMTEMAVAYNLQLLRMNLPVAADVESRRSICAAISEAARAIDSIRKALQARTHLV